MTFSSGFVAGASVRDQRDARRQQAEERNQNLQMLGYDFSNGEMSVRPNSPAEQQQLAAQEAVIRSKALFSKLAKNETAQAFEDYSLTGDANFLNNDLNSSPEKKAAWAQKGVHLVSNLDFENDANLLAKSGLQPTAYDTPEKRDIIKKNVYKIYNGKEWGIGLANQAMAETGALKTLGSRRGAPAIANHKELVGLLSGPKVSPYTAEGHKYEKQINSASEKYNLPPDLLASMINTESNSNPKAISPKGASGVMQLMPDTAKSLGVTDIHNVDQNIDAGAKYLRQQLDKYGGDVKLALAAYNAGPGNVDKYGGVPPFGETQQYINKVTSNLDEGSQHYGRTAMDVYDSLLQNDREQAAAAKGMTADQVSRATEADIAASELKPREVDQKDRQLDIEEQGQAIKLEEIKAKLATEGRTETRKKLDDAAKTTDELYNTFGGEQKFYATDFSNQDTPEYREAFSKMVEVEQLTGMKPTETDEKEWKELRTLIHLSGDVSNLTEEQVGLVDKNLKTVKKYLSENMTGIEAQASWTAFRNIYIHAMAGTAQSEAEAKRISESFGKLEYKLGPVITHFQTQLKELDARINSSSSNMLSVSAKVRLGADKDKLKGVRENIKTTIDYMQAKQAHEEDNTKPNPGTYNGFIKKRAEDKDNKLEKFKQFVTED